MGVQSILPFFLKVMLGELPNDFLRTGQPPTQEQEDERIARILQAQQQAGVNVFTSSNVVGRLSISVVQVTIFPMVGQCKFFRAC